jgi:hypothetical protein
MRRRDRLTIPLSAAEGSKETGNIRFAIRKPARTNLAPESPTVVTAVLPPAQQIVLIGIEDAPAAMRLLWWGWP